MPSTETATRSVDRFSCALREVKFAGDGEDGTFEGYGSVFGNLDFFRDVIAPGAFKRSLADWRKRGALPPLLLNHGGMGLGASDDLPIGLWTSMREDDVGLRVEGKLAIGTELGRSAYELLKMTPRPAINGLSIGYLAKKWTAGTKPDEPRRTLTDIDLIELSLVTFPANQRALVDAVKAGRVTTIRQYEAVLRDVCGFARYQAKVLAAGGWPALVGRDARGGGFGELARTIRKRAAKVKLLHGAKHDGRGQR